MKLVHIPETDCVHWLPPAEPEIEITLLADPRGSGGEREADSSEEASRD